MKQFPVSQSTNLPIYQCTIGGTGTMARPSATRVSRMSASARTPSGPQHSRPLLLRQCQRVAHFGQAQHHRRFQRRPRFRGHIPLQQSPKVFQAGDDHPVVPPRYLPFQSLSQAGPSPHQPYPRIRLNASSDQAHFVLPPPKDNHNRSLSRAPVEVTQEKKSLSRSTLTRPSPDPFRTHKKAQGDPPSR